MRCGTPRAVEHRASASRRRRAAGRSRRSGRASRPGTVAGAGQRGARRCDRSGERRRSVRRRTDAATSRARSPASTASPPTPMPGGAARAAARGQLGARSPRAPRRQRHRLLLAARPRRRAHRPPGRRRSRRAPPNASTSPTATAARGPCRPSTSPRATATSRSARSAATSSTTSWSAARAADQRHQLAAAARRPARSSARRTFASSTSRFARRRSSRHTSGASGTGSGTRPCGSSRHRRPVVPGGAGSPRKRPRAVLVVQDERRLDAHAARALGAFRELGVAPEHARADARHELARAGQHDARAGPVEVDRAAAEVDHERRRAGARAGGGAEHGGLGLGAHDARRRAPRPGPRALASAAWRSPRRAPVAGAARRPRRPAAPAAGSTNTSSASGARRDRRRRAVGRGAARAPPGQRRPPRTGCPSACRRGVAGAARLGRVEAEQHRQPQRVAELGHRAPRLRHLDRRQHALRQGGAPATSSTIGSAAIDAVADQHGVVPVDDRAAHVPAPRARVAQRRRGLLEVLVRDDRDRRRRPATRRAPPAAAAGRRRRRGPDGVALAGTRDRASARGRAPRSCERSTSAVSTGPQLGQQQPRRPARPAGAIRGRRARARRRRWPAIPSRRWWRVRSTSRNSGGRPGATRAKATSVVELPTSTPATIT